MGGARGFLFDVSGEPFSRHLTDWDRWAHAEYERLEAEEEEEEMAHSYADSRDVQRGGAGRLRTRGGPHH